MNNINLVAKSLSQSMNLLGLEMIQITEQQTI